MKIYGLDISLDHSAVVTLNEDGSVCDYVYLTSVKKLFEVDPSHSVLLSKRGQEESKDAFRLRRMNEIMNAPIFWTAQHNASSEYFSIEGYSYASKSTSICQIAELTGYMKLMLFTGGGKLRIHAPTTVKQFATGKGNASKKDVAVLALSKFDIPDGLIKRKTIRKKGKTILRQEDWWEDYDGPVTDIADAYFLARMLYTELKLRSGEITLDKLPENERSQFLRVTPTYPVNILARPFICKTEERK